MEYKMKKLVLLLGVTLTLSACQKLPEPVCYGKAMVGGSSTSVPIYAIKKEGKYTLYRAGSIFNWRWVGQGAFTSINCPKS